MERVIVYVDGFNLYFGLTSKCWQRYYWLNLQKLAQNLLQEDQKLVTTKYFTSRISFPPDKVKRQSIFIEALETLDKFWIFYGHYVPNAIECRKWGNILSKPNEKMTNLNIAVEILSDAFQDEYDKAILISADSDLFAPIMKLKELFPDKKLVVAFPPDRFSFTLAKIASASFIIGRMKIADSIFPDKVIEQDGFILTRPENWR